ncbi:MAG TPA: hypothetical protein DEV81_20500 [Cyanobacteria bacterium UBA11049]|nr:hypothetical protein [Cyanobacteria bacterium UBA11049]
MYPSLAKGEIRPKFSSIPRQKSEAAAYLDSYKLAIEKKRLQQELQTIDRRHQQISRRLTLIDTQVSQLEKSIEQIHTSKPEVLETIVPKQTLPGAYSTMFLEY